MLFYVMFLGFLPVLGTFCMALVVTSIVDCLRPIVKAVLIGIAAIVLLPRLLSIFPVIIALAALGALANGVKRIIG